MMQMLVSLLCVMQLTVSSVRSLPVDVRAALREDAASITFTIRSSGQKPIHVFDAALPWRNYSSVVIVVVTLGGETIPSEWPIDDPTGKIVTLKPGGTLAGAIDLYRRFPSLKKRRAQQDLVVFWSYQLVALDPAARSTRVGGWWLLPEEK